MDVIVAFFQKIYSLTLPAHILGPQARSDRYLTSPSKGIHNVQCLSDTPRNVPEKAGSATTGKGLLQQMNWHLSMFHFLKLWATDNICQ